MKRRFLIWALGALALACGGAARSTEPPLTVAAVEPVPAAPRHSTADELFKRNLRESQEAARRRGWVLAQVVPIEGRFAAVVLYSPAPENAPATLLARYEAVSTATGVVLAGESGMIELVKTRGGSLLWDLKGDGARFVVLGLTSCGANCGQAVPKVLELTEDRFIEPATAPTCPQCIQDFDRDRVPEFSFRMATLKIAPCSRVSCGPSYGLEVEVRGLESWEGERYARDLREFIPIYFDRLRRAKRDAERLAKVKNRAGRCPLTAVRVAAELYVYGRLIGESEQDALRTADAVMKGYALQPCAAEFDLLAPPKDWATLRAELVALPLPELTRERGPRPGG